MPVGGAGPASTRLSDLHRPDPTFPSPVAPHTAAGGAQVTSEAAVFSSKRRKRGEKATCRVPHCNGELITAFHQKYRICKCAGVGLALRNATPCRLRCVRLPQ